MARRAGAAAVVAAVSLASGRAAASYPFPYELQVALGLPKPPPCTVCHGEETADDAGPADTLFARAMIAHGLTGDGEVDGGAMDAATIDPSMRMAIGGMQRDHVDSDGDGADDLDELYWGGDPNHYDGPPASQVTAPTYGCDVSAGRRADGGMLGAFVAAWALGRAGRRPTRGR